jgi:hypothetical protein
VNHREFLAESNLGRRRPFAEALIAALRGAKRPLIVRSSYEKTTLTELARVLPDLARTVAGIVKVASIGRRGSDRKLATLAKVLSGSA